MRLGEDDIKLYLPQYLSEDGMKALKRDLRHFSEGHDSGEYFTNRLKNEPYLLQGDLTKSLYCNLPDPRLGQVPVILLSNTCDMDLDNIRLNPCRIMFAPIINLNKYRLLLENNNVKPSIIDSHIADIKNQVVSQIFYLPTEILWGYDSIVMFDRIISLPLTKDNINQLIADRSATLSNYGFYLLLLKLSYHFTRIQEKVDRSI